MSCPTHGLYACADRCQDTSLYIQDAEITYALQKKTIGRGNDNLKRTGNHIAITCTNSHVPSTCWRVSGAYRLQGSWACEYKRKRNHQTMLGTALRISPTRLTTTTTAIICEAIWVQKALSGHVLASHWHSWRPLRSARSGMFAQHVATSTKSGSSTPAIRFHRTAICRSPRTLRRPLMLRALKFKGSQQQPLNRTGV